MTRREKTRAGWGKAEFWKAAYLEALGPAMNNDWSDDGKPLISIGLRCGVAATIADESLKEAEERGFA